MTPTTSGSFSPGDLVCFKDEWGSHNEREIRVHPYSTSSDKGHYCIFDYHKDEWIVVPNKEVVDPIIGRHTFDYFLVIRTHPAQNAFQTDFVCLLFPDGNEILVNTKDLDEERTIHANSEEELVQKTD